MTAGNLLVRTRDLLRSCYSPYEYICQTGMHPVRSPLISLKETGFLPNLPCVTKYFVKNPVSGPLNLTQRNRVFTEFTICNKVFRKKPGFWTPTDI